MTEDHDTADVRTTRLGQVGELTEHVRWLLGGRRRWILVLPVLSTLAAASEVLLLLTIIRSLLLLVDSSSSTTVSVGSFTRELSWSDLLWVAAIASAFSIALRVIDSVLVGRLAATAAFTAR